MRSEPVAQELEHERPACACPSIRTDWRVAWPDSRCTNRTSRPSTFRFRAAWRASACVRWSSCRCCVEQRSGVFAVLLVARRAAQAFSSGECEFLRQLCDHVALAANQAQFTPRCSRPTTICDARRRPCSNRSGCARSARWRAASRTTSTTRSRRSRSTSKRCSSTKPASAPRTREQLEIIQRAIDDVARTVARMGEFYRKRPAQLELAPVARQPGVARRARSHARALERHGAAARRGHRGERRERRRTHPPSWASKASCARRW